MPDSSRGITFLEALQVTYKRRRFLIVQFCMISVAAVVIVLVIPKTYSSSATVLPPSVSSLSGIMPSNMTTGLGGVISSITSTPGSDTNRLVSILKSRDLAEQVIDRFDLLSRYQADTIEEGIEAFREQVQYTIDEEKMVRITVFVETGFLHPEEDEQESTLLARDMCQYIIDYLDERYTLLQTQKARYERELIGDRLAQSGTELEAAQKALRAFSERTGVVSLPDQLEAGIAAAAQLESELVINEIELRVLENTYNPNSSEVISKQQLVDQLRTSLDEMLSDQQDSIGVLPKLSDSPALIQEYANLQREITIQNLIYEFLIQQYEQIKLQEAKESPSLQFIDTPHIPTDKVRPVRSLLVIIIVVLGMMLSLLFVLVKEYYRSELRRIASSITRHE